MVASFDQDLAKVTSRLRGVLDSLRGKLRVSDAIVLAGFARRSQQRMKLVGCAMRKLGWTRGRYRFDGALQYAYARGSYLEREVVLEVVIVKRGRHAVKRREP